jgi:quercetin dioxygenase-like cupin family protein
MSTTEDLERHLPPAPEPLDPWFVERILAMVTAAPDAPAALVERHAARRGMMPPLHTHDEDETVRVVSGELTFFVGDEVVRARAGDVVVAPRRVARTYRVESDGARWLVLTRLASVARFEDFGRALAEPGDTAGWPSEEELRSLRAIAAANGIEILGPPGSVPSLFC